MKIHPSLLKRCSVSIRHYGILALVSVAAAAASRAGDAPSVSAAAWGMAFGVSAEQLVSPDWLTEDADGDGQSNGAELTAGTNPVVAGSVLTVSDIKIVGKNVEIGFPSISGKSYKLEENGSLSSPSGWQASAGASKIGTGSPLSFSVLKQPNTYYRVVVQDIDSDGDGISNYAENIFVTNPALYPSGPPTSPGGGVSASAATSVVTVRAPQSVAYEDGPLGGKFTISRTGGTSALLVGYSVTGTATAVTDHNRVSGSLNLGVGVNSIDLPVMPVLDSTVEAGETCTLTVTWILSFEPTGPTSITPGVPNSATVVIVNSAVATGTGLLGQYYDTASTTYANSANFNATQLKVTRLDPVVDFTWLQGTPNGITISPNNSPDNYSASWEGYLNPTTAGSYMFQVDADDKAQVLLDLNGNGVFDLPAEQIVEHGWNGPATAGTFKQSAAVTLAVPANAAARYRFRVDHVETTGDATCRLQWNLNGGTFANVPQAQVFSHTQAVTYSYTKVNTTSGNAVITPSGGHTLAAGNQVYLNFSSGNLFTATTSYNGLYTIAAVNGTTTFTVPIAGTAVPSTGTGSGFVGNSASTTTGLLNLTYANTTLSGAPGRVGVDGAVTASNNGIWGAGTPDLLINPDTFSVRWTGQVQPQYSEEYTFVVNCDDSAKLSINGQPQTLKVATTASSAGTYTYTSATGDMVVTHSNIPAGSFAVGETVRVDPTAGTITALAFADYVVTAVGTGTFTIKVGAGLGDQLTGSTCSIEWINKPIDWNTVASSTSADRYARISLMGGVRYDIKLEYIENTSSAKCQLSWYSPSQTKQIIPSNRLYPASASPQAPSVTSSTGINAFVGGPFSYVIVGTNGGTLSISGRPTWLNLIGNVLTGTPPDGVAGDYQLVVTTTSAAGTGASVLNLHVSDNTAAPVVREYWNGIAGTTVASIPTTTAPSGMSNLTSLEAPTDFGDDYGTRIRGFLTAPTTGNYCFWIAASNEAELWISNDADPVNSIKRAYVTAGTASLEWSAAGETHQKSPVLALEEGQKYYFEILHKAGTGAGDNLAVGWLKPGESGAAPSQVVPGYIVSTYVPAASATPGTLYLSTMLSQGGATTKGVGTATLRVSDDETSAVLRYSYSGLSGPITNQHIHVDAYLTKPSVIVFDMDTPVTSGDGLQPDGSYKWTILDVSPYSAAEIREIIKQGKAYVNLHTALYPNGEIRGNFTLAGGSRTFSVPPAPQSWTDDHDTDAGAARFLTQATFGSNIADITALKAMSSYEAWIDVEFGKPASHHLPEVLARDYVGQNGFGAFDQSLTFNAWWRNAISADDQLRQRVAFALSQIHVVSAQGPLDNRADALSYFYDKLVDNALGNFRTLLEATTLTPTMGRYLDMLKNDRQDLTIGKIPNENYAREIMQLFSIGLYRMWPDGSLILNSQDEPVPTYTQREIVGLAHVFTGWDYGYDGAYRTALGSTTNWIRQMRETPARHDTAPKRILNNEVLPGITTAGGQTLDSSATHASTQYNDPAYQALPAQELAAVHDQLFNHPNVGPFLCRQLIQRLVTSNPSRDYLYRVVQKFNDNGSGVRGDMQAVVKAVLLDYEARSTNNLTKNTYGKQREGILRTAAAARAFRQGTVSGTYDQPTGSHIINVTAANKLQAGNTVYLEFPRGAFVPGDITPTSEAYTVLTTPAPTATTFSVNAKGWAGVSTSLGATNAGVTGTYSIPINSSTMTVTLTSHWLGANDKAYFDFTTGTGNAMADGLYTSATSTSTDLLDGSAVVAGTTFTVTVTADATGARTGFVRIPRFQASYIHVNSGLAAPNERRITIGTLSGTTTPNADHHLSVGDRVWVNTTEGLFPVVDGEYIVETVPDSNTFTIVTDAAHTSGTTNDNENGVWLFPLKPQPTGRSGSVNALPSTFNMNNSDADIEQTPLNSPTVFNFFLPDYKYPGSLASAGITTPEFQDTAETTVVRSSNFVFNAMFTNSGNTNGISAFKSSSGGVNALVLDLSPWMANATDLGLGAGPNTGQPWTSNANVGTLIAHLNALLSTSMSSNARAVIENFVTYQKIITSMPFGNPCSITTSTAHGLATGNSITLTGISGGTFQNATTSSAVTINSTWAVTVTSSTTFTLDNVKCASTSGLNLASARASYVPYDDAAPTATNMRDRLRSILHLILTSPDFTIQR